MKKDLKILSKWKIFRAIKPVYIKRVLKILDASVLFRRKK